MADMLLAEAVATEELLSITCLSENGAATPISAILTNINARKQRLASFPSGGAGNQGPAAIAQYAERVQAIARQKLALCQLTLTLSGDLLTKMLPSPSESGPSVARSLTLPDLPDILNPFRDMFRSTCAGDVFAPFIAAYDEALDAETVVAKVASEGGMDFAPMLKLYQVFNRTLLERFREWCSVWK